MAGAADQPAGDCVNGVWNGGVGVQPVRDPRGHLRLYCPRADPPNRGRRQRHGHDWADPWIREPRRQHNAPRGVLGGSHLKTVRNPQPMTGRERPELAGKTSLTWRFTLRAGDEKRTRTILLAWESVPPGLLTCEAGCPRGP